MCIRVVVVATTKVHIFKQITTVQCMCKLLISLLLLPQRYIFSSKSQPYSQQRKYLYSCCCYHKGTYFQANHNYFNRIFLNAGVVVATTKVHIFKQITTNVPTPPFCLKLLLLPQRYIFSSKSQLN